MTAYVFPTGFFGLPTGEQLNSLANNGAVTITSGTIDGTAIGGTTPAAVAATTLTANNAVTLSPASHNVVLSPTGSGVVTIDPATAGSMDNVALGGTTPLAAHVTTLNATGAVVMSNASLTIANLGTVDPHSAGRLWTNSGVVTVSAG